MLRTDDTNKTAGAMTDEDDGPVILCISSAVASASLQGGSRTHCIILLPIAGCRRQEIQRIVRDVVLRHHGSPIWHVRIVAEGENARVLDLEGSRV